jgi:hypothetical protein
MGKIHSSLKKFKQTAQEATMLEQAAAASRVGASAALETKSAAVRAEGALKQTAAAKKVTDASAGKAASDKKADLATKTQIYQAMKADKSIANKLAEATKDKAAKEKAYALAEAGAKAAQKKAEAQRALADTAHKAYAAGAKGGKCCSWKDPGGAGSERVMTQECCSADKCKTGTQRTRHRECNFNGELTANGCKCGAGFGGADCRVEATSQCFNGKRSDGSSPGLAGCSSCYKCQQGLPKLQGGAVTVAGEDRCETLQGPEELCLSCGPGAGLVRSGDKQANMWELGYHSLGKCVKYPGHIIASAQPQCVSNCFPRRVGDYRTATLHVCNKVCSVWNKVQLKVGSTAVNAAGACTVSKEDACHAADGETLASLSKARRCFAKKHAHPAKVCYQMNKSAGGTTYGNGYGTGCADGARPAKDAGLSGAGSEKWCCWEIQEGKAAEFKPPKWLEPVSLKQWCTGALLAV